MREFFADCAIQGVVDMRQKGKWILLIAALGLILLLNLQGKDATMALSNKVSAFLQAVFPDDSAWIAANIRKLGHIMEYFLLGFACYCCFGWKCLVCCTVFSVLDQCFKELIPVRHFDSTDLPYDMLGYVLGACAGWVGKKIKEKRRK